MPQGQTSSKRPRLAAVITAYKPILHGQQVWIGFSKAMDGMEPIIIRRWTWYPSMSINAAPAI